LSGSRSESLTVKVTVETVDEGARLLRHTIVIDQAFEPEILDHDPVGKMDEASGPNGGHSKNSRERLASLIMWVAVLALALFLAAAILSSVRVAPSAIVAAGLAALIARSAIQAAGQIAASTKPTK
jgi:hypothetical protein